MVNKPQKSSRSNPNLLKPINPKSKVTDVKKIRPRSRNQSQKRDALDNQSVRTTVDRKPRQALNPSQEILYDNTKHSSWYGRLPRLKFGLRMVSLIIAIPIILFGFKLAYSLNAAVEKSTGSNIFSIVDFGTKLKGEDSGRVNILLVGIGNNDHEAGDLADTVIIASLDTRNNQVAMISLPRDLLVDIPGYGTNRINAAHSLGEDQDGRGMPLLIETIESNFKMEIDYYIRSNFDGLIQAVDVVGGITVDNPESINDYSYPCDYNPSLECGYFLTEGQHQLDGTEALKYSRSRKGSAAGDYSRAGRQQEVLIAIKDKALSIDTLLNVNKMTELIDLAGDNVKTDFDLSEIKRVVDLVKGVNDSKIINEVISTENFLEQVSGSSLGSVVRPIDNDYQAIADHIASIFVLDQIKSENAKVSIYNASGVAGRANNLAIQLEYLGLRVIEIDNAPSIQPNTSVEYYTDGLVDTVGYLDQKLGVDAELSIPDNDQLYNIKIVIGQDYYDYQD
ncbi:LCP family protein [Candidatus Saccharibacteria bacterium]|nr:LCP family protein [Candidatus Saccharibacteria bacterium]